MVATLFGLIGLAGVVVFLTGQGLDRAEKWVSLVGVFVSVAVGIGGLVIGWLAWRQTPAGTERRGSVRRTGNATATGRGSTAISGSVGTGATVVDRTGDATAKRGGRAVTGEDRSEPQS